MTTLKQHDATCSVFRGNPGWVKGRSVCICKRQSDGPVQEPRRGTDGRFIPSEQTYRERVRRFLASVTPAFRAAIEAEAARPATEPDWLRELRSKVARYDNAYARAKELVRGSPVDWTDDPPSQEPDGWWRYTSQNNRDVIAAAILVAHPATEGLDASCSVVGCENAAPDRWCGTHAPRHPTSEGLDVKRLATAIWNVRESDPAEWLERGEEADAIAAEYARLASEDRTSDE